MSTELVLLHVDVMQAGRITSTELLKGKAASAEGKEF